MSNKPELEQDKSNIFGTIGSVIGSIVGGPGGAVVGNLLGQTAGGREFNSLQDVFQTGLGTFFNAQMGPAGLAFNAMGGGGGGENNQQAGAGLMGLLGSPQVAQMLAASSGANPQMQALAMGLAQANQQGGDYNSVLGPVFAGIMNQKMLDNRTNTFEPFSDMYNSGERTKYKGTVAPGTPVVNYNKRNAATGGMIDGPGTGTSDSIPAMIYQNGGPVQEAALSDGEFVMTADAVRGAGGGNRDAGAAKMYQMMNQFERRA
tara:strand:- start:656 stop:1438 length:783 start_codon:yes stop_codon:yes gene_type:complete